MSEYRTAPPIRVATRLKVLDGGCMRTIGHVVEDAAGRLWLSNVDRLQDPRDGHWWRNEETVEILDINEWLYLGCTKGGPKCGQAFSWRLSEHGAKLAQARAENRVIELRL